MGKLATILLGLAVAGAPVAVGAVHTPVVATLLVVLVLANAVNVANGVRMSRSGDESRRQDPTWSWLSLPAAAFTLLAAWCGLQLVPLPPGLLGIMQPEGARILAESFAVAFPGEPAPWHPISMDPGATADRGLRWLVLGLGAWTAANLHYKRRWRSIYITILVAGVVTLAVGTALTITDRETFFGLYEPTLAFRGPSPFVSTNHAATFYGLCGLVGFGGLALRREHHPLEASVAGALGLLFVALAAVHDSDAVMAAMGLSVLVFGVGLVVRTESGGQLREAISHQAGRLAYGSVVAVCLVLLGWWLGLLEVFEGIIMSPLEGSESALNRTEIMLGALAASTDYFGFGAGGGAVDVTVGRYIDWSSLRPASIPVVENDPVEWLLTYGWFAAGAAIVALTAGGVCSGRRMVKSSRGARWVVGTALYIYGACVALFHFPFFALGIALPLVVAIEGMTAPRKPPKARGIAWSGHIAMPGWVNWVVLAVAVVAGVAFFGVNRSRLVEFDADAHELVMARPSDGRVFAELASRALEASEEDRAVALARWSEKLDRAPDARVFLARTLGQTGNDTEAAKIYRDLLASPVQGTMVRYHWLVLDLERAEDRALALGEASGPQIEGAVRMVAKMQGPEAATDVVLELSDVRGDDPALHRAAIDTFLALEAPDLAELWASSVNQRGVSDGGIPIGPELMAKVAMARGDRDAARVVAAEALAGDKPGVEIARVYLMLLPPVDSASEDVDELVARASDLACRSPLPAHLRRPCWLAEAWQLERRGELEDATLVYQRIASRLKMGTPLAEFWSRHGRCLEMRRYIEELDSGSVQNAMRRVAARCNVPADKLTPRKAR